VGKVRWTAKEEEAMSGSNEAVGKPEVGQEVLLPNTRSYFQIEAAARRGLFKWREKPHNEKWWKKIDGTPIPNDLIVCVAGEIVAFGRSATAREREIGKIALAGTPVLVRIPDSFQWELAIKVFHN
jgi:hypothetical protein